MLIRQVVILCGSQHGQNSEEQQLQATQARSHAARVSHARRKLTHPYYYGKKKRRKSSKHRTDQQSHPVGPGGHSRQTSTELQSKTNRSQCLLPDPVTTLSQSRQDPFNAEVARDIPALGHKSLEYAYLNILPDFDYGITKAWKGALIAHWRSSAVQSALSFHAHMSNAVSLCYSITADPLEKADLMQIRWKHQALTMHIIRERLQKLSGPADDDLLENLLRIASQGGNLSQDNMISRYPETPLADAMLLKLYSRFEIGLPHWRAIVELVRGRGGLERVSPYFSHRLVLSDAVVSSRLGSRPNFTVLEDMWQLSDAQQFDFDAEALELYSTMRTGWWVSGLQESHADLVAVAIHAALLTAALDQSHRQATGCLSIFLICRLATIFQHDLNDLNPLQPQMFNPEARPDDVFDVARLGVQIFSDLVLFPLSQGYAAKPRLIKQMRRALAAYQPVTRAQLTSESGSMSPDSRPSLLLWATVMGTVIAEGTKDRYWFMRRLIDLISRTDLDPESWDEFRAIMARHLWWDYVFDEHVMHIWREVWGLEAENEQCDNGTDRG